MPRVFFDTSEAPRTRLDLRSSFDFNRDLEDEYWHDRFVRYSNPRPRSSEWIAASLDYQKTQQNMAPSPRDLQDFVNIYSENRSIRMCGLAQLRCRHPLCPYCGPRKMRALRAALHAASQEASISTVLHWTATLESTPSQPLGFALQDLRQVMTATLRNAWMTRRFTGTARVTEITHSDQGWHPHAHTILVLDLQLSRDETAALRLAIIDRWTDEARRAGVRAELQAQHVDDWPVGDLGNLVRYLTKDNVLRAPDHDVSSTPGDILRRAFEGDGEAFALLHELDSIRGMHSHARTGSLRPPKVI